MLQKVCETLHNYDFGREIRRHSGTFEISGGAISLPFLLEGQRFLIEGSILNDGLYTYHAAGIKDDDDSAVVWLHDETFAGTICALAVPPAVIALSAEIKAWVDKYGEKSSSPYASEEVIGVYSYTKASGGSGTGGAITWKDAFSDQLKPYRKVCW